jgi:putative proteasome-type protease
MTYCVGLLLDEGLVMASDSRTNAGVDYISSYSKLHLFQPAPDRLFVLLAAGSLATTQEVLARIQRDLDFAFDPRPGPYPVGDGPTLLNVNYLFEAAAYIGHLSLAVQNEHGPALRQAGASPEASFILGGQIAGRPQGLFLIYPQGNCIAASRETPYLQIGEHKFGKPALDLIAEPGLSLDDGARLCLVSLEGTARSNLTVAPPFEVIICPRDQSFPSQRLKLEADSPDLETIRRTWTEGPRQTFFGLPRFSWEQGQAPDGDTAPLPQ